MKRPMWFRALVLIAASAGGGSLLQVGCARTIGANVNPCGTILSPQICNAFGWDALFVTADDWDRDPTCTIPYFCGPWPPTAAPGGSTNTTTTTTTTGTTTGLFGGAGTGNLIGGF